MESKKLDNFTIEVTKQAPQPEPVKTAYQRKYIEEQMVEIQRQKDEQMAQRDAELAECQDILKEMDKQGILTKSSTAEDITV
jgi:hypothetical protein